jgi:hypothetical protein
MKVFDFRNKKLSEIQKILVRELNLSIKLAKKIAFVINKLPKYKREIIPEKMEELLRAQDETRILSSLNTIAKKSYTDFLNRDDHTNVKEFQDMTINEWAHYLIDQFEYPKDIAKKCGRSMYEFIKENNSIDQTSDGKLTLYPLLKD